MTSESKTILEDARRNLEAGLGYLRQVSTANGIADDVEYSIRQLNDMLLDPSEEDPMHTHYTTFLDGMFGEAISSWDKLMCIREHA